MEISRYLYKSSLRLIPSFFAIGWFLVEPVRRAPTVPYSFLEVTPPPALTLAKASYLESLVCPPRLLSCCLLFQFLCLFPGLRGISRFPAHILPRSLGESPAQLFSLQCTRPRGEREGAVLSAPVPRPGLFNEVSAPFVGGGGERGVTRHPNSTSFLCPAVKGERTTRLVTGGWHSPP